MSTKKALSSFAMVLLLALFAGGVAQKAQAVTDDVTTSLGVLSTITVACADGAITMGDITGTGQSALTTNSEACTVTTNNSSGYNLGVLAATAAMNSGSDTIAAYTPASPGVPETWSVAGSASEWGVHLGSASTTVNTTTWGTADTYAGGNWVNAPLTNTEIANRATETSGSGDTEIIYVGAEVGASVLQPTGTYTNTITVTALTNP